MKLAVIGQNISYSLSPKIHQFWIQQYGLTGTYELLDMQEHLDLRLLAGYQGANVTIPFKEKIIPYLDDLTPLAQSIGAVNVIYLSGDQWIGDNTDCVALREVIANFEPATKALVLGSGGAARAATKALQQLNLEAVTCSRRRAAQDWLAWEDRHQEINRFNVIINATPLGLNGAGNPLEILPARRSLIVDMVYQPVETPLLRLARRSGHQVGDGLGLLIRQARHSFGKWWGFLPDYESVRGYIS